MTLATRLHDEYLSIRDDCALATAADSRYVPYLLNTLNSIHERFPTHPTVHVFDLGMTKLQSRELSSVPWVKIRQLEAFAPHWQVNWSWKPYLLTQVKERYVLYFDAANFVVFRPLELWFLAIRRNGYLFLDNWQRMGDITPSDYWELFGVDKDRFASAPTFGAGLFGIDAQSPAADGVREAVQRTKEGWILGCSAKEKNPFYDRSFVRECSCFRADQTLLNLAMRKRYGDSLLVRKSERYHGLGKTDDHPRQFVWYCRRKRGSLVYFWQPLGRRSAEYWYSRTTSFAKLEFLHHARTVGRTLRGLLKRH